ncbi:hypothetical protein XPA_010004 [Xanthoria parietina]
MAYISTRSGFIDASNQLRHYSIGTLALDTPATSRARCAELTIHKPMRDHAGRRGGGLITLAPTIKSSLSAVLSNCLGKWLTSVLNNHHHLLSTPPSSPPSPMASCTRSIPRPSSTLQAAVLVDPISLQ